MSRQLNIAIVGVTGAVGETFLTVLKERKFPVKTLYPLASVRSIGKTIRFNHADAGDVAYSVGRAIDLYYNKRDLFTWMRSYMMHIDHSWESSAGEYIRLYESLK